MLLFSPQARKLCPLRWKVELRPGHEIDVDDADQVAAFRNKIWPLIEEANVTAPAFSKIFKEMILITQAEKPILRAGKGTVMRKATLKAYESEIDALYNTIEANESTSGAASIPRSWSTEDLVKWLLDRAADIHPDRMFSPDVDLFEQGFDSLSATFLRHNIMGALRATPTIPKELQNSISQNIVYANPTIAQLAKHLSSAALLDVASTLLIASITSSLWSGACAFSAIPIVTMRRLHALKAQCA
jgi:hypothetical protein